MLFFHIIIPYTFLMNTSYNKDRIINDGWETVLLNPLTCSCFSNPSSVEVIPISGQVSGNAEESSAKRETGKEEQPKSKVCCKPSSNTYTSGAENCERVFTISKKDLDKPKVTINSDLEVEDLEIEEKTGHFIFS